MLYHSCVIQQLQKLHDAVKRAEKSTPDKFESNANVKLFRALSKLILDVVPNDPSQDEYRQGNTLGPAYRHWRRAKIGRRFRLPFRYDSKAKIIVYAWVNDEETLHSESSKSDPYAVFEKMLGRGNPPDDWATLIAASQQKWS
ncbi:type II toxin-antitoxin system YhaV family toxin [Photorhabdus asymbiotica]|uniref:type II toxin-antitoxin system YhaV family toxin n=1 Tax=Photorhabdus asymbiotica TaxID=291112 RepID=UPI003DA6E951